MVLDDPQLVERFLEVVHGLAGQDVEALLGGRVSQRDVSRWRRGDWQKLLSAKRRFLADFLKEYGRGDHQPGREAVVAVARKMGVGESERLTTLKRWLSHPRILPPSMPLEERFRIGERVLEVDGYTKRERDEFFKWRDTIREAADAESGSPVPGRN